MNYGGWGISYEIAPRWMPLDLTNDKSLLVQVMAWCRQATSHYLSQCWSRSMSPNDVARPQWVNSLWSRELIWRHRCWLTLAQVKAWCQMAPSHYLNHYWLIISQVRSNDSHPKAILQVIPQPSIIKLAWKLLLKFHSNLPGANVIVS